MLLDVAEVFLGPLEPAVGRLRGLLELGGLGLRFAPSTFDEGARGAGCVDERTCAVERPLRDLELGAKVPQRDRALFDLRAHEVGENGCALL